MNVWRALPDLGPDAGVSLVPAAAAIQPGIEPRSRISGRVIALAVGGVVVIAIVLIVGALMFTQRPRASQAAPGQAAVVGSSPAMHDLAVEVQVDQTLGAGDDPWSEVQVGGPCEPVRRGVSRHPERDAGPRRRPVGRRRRPVHLPTGRKAAPGLCSFVTRVPTPDASRYGIGIADRTAIVFSFEELSQAGWTTLIKYVEAP